MKYFFMKEMKLQDSATKKRRFEVNKIAQNIKGTSKEEQWKILCNFLDDEQVEE